MIRREPALPEPEAIVSEQPKLSPEIALLDDEPDDDATKAMNQSFRAIARQAALDPTTASGCEFRA